MEKFFLFLLKLSPKIKRTLWRWCYQNLVRSYPQFDWRFMNYGFCDINSELGNLNLSQEEEQNRYFIQLYHYLARATDLQDKIVLEVGSGRGGGAAYIADYLNPKKIIGIDFSQENIKLACQTYEQSNLSFQLGDAEALPFDSDSFDVVLNLESSHCYGSMTRFIQEVYRVLKPGGIFSWADFRSVEELESLKQIFKQSKFELIQNTNITPQVVKALLLVNQRKQHFIDRYVPGFLKTAFKEFAAVEDSEMYQSFRTGKNVYLNYVFRK